MATAAKLTSVSILRRGLLMMGEFERVSRVGLRSGTASRLWIVVMVVGSADVRG